MRKLGPVALAAEAAGYARLIEPSYADIEERLRQLHDPVYVEDFLSGVDPSASAQGWSWTPDIRDGVMAIHEGQLCAAKTALEEGLAANVAQGFHHATYQKGAAFCTFNGLALVAQEHPDKTIFVLDCDEHGGNGTQDFIGRMHNLHQTTLCGQTYGCTSRERSTVFHFDSPITQNWKVYLDALTKSFNLIKGCNADLVIYQAGADPHIDDPLGTTGMTTEQMNKRDQVVFEFLLGEKIPSMFVLAGGYQEPIQEKLVPLHLQTFACALTCLSMGDVVLR